MTIAHKFAKITAEADLTLRFKCLDTCVLFIKCIIYANKLHLSHDLPHSLHASMDNNSKTALVLHINVSFKFTGQAVFVLNCAFEKFRLTIYAKFL